MPGRLIRTAALAAVAAVVTLAGCASMTGPRGYPADWPAAETSAGADDCPAISGTYENLGLASDPPEFGNAPPLSALFAMLAAGTGVTGARETGVRWPEPDAPVRVAFTLSGDALEVAFASEDASVATLHFRRFRPSLSERRFDDLFTCYASPSGDRLRFMAEPESHSAAWPGLSIEGGGTLVFLLKASDGSLVVHWRQETLRVTSLGFGSGMRYRSLWWRYAPAAAARRSASALAASAG